MINKNGVDCCSCREGINCSDTAKHPRTRYGLNEATTDKQKIRDWWKKHPDSNVGIATGRKSGIFVLDIDEGGEFSLDEIQEFHRSALGSKFEPLPEALTCITGSGGRHLYFRLPADVEIRGSLKKIAPGLDIRAEGNFVAAPPSLHKTGNKYKWCGIELYLERCQAFLKRASIIGKLGCPSLG